MIVIVVAIALAIPAFILTRNFVASWEITSLPGVAVKYNQQGEPQVSGEVPTPENVAIPKETLPGDFALHRPGRTRLGRGTGRATFGHHDPVHHRSTQQNRGYAIHPP